jgi:cation:H+ antiporter
MRQRQIIGVLWIKNRIIFSIGIFVPFFQMFDLTLSGFPLGLARSKEEIRMEIALLIIGGLVLLLAGGEFLVRGAVHIAERFNISPLVIGIVLVGFGTSSPELITSLFAAFEGAPGIAVGNVVGSNIANILLILGATALIAPIAVEGGKGFVRDSSFLMVASLLCVAACLIGSLNQIAGLVFIIGLAGYIFMAFKQSGQDAEKSEVIEQEFGKPRNPIVDIAMFVGGLTATIIGARLLVTGSIDLARDFGISETVIGLTIVAVGTSLPELVASIMAALRKHSAIAYGNIIGSNIYNILGILGITAIIKPIDVPPQIVQLDIWVMLGTAALLLIFARSKWVISRVEGGVLLALYVAYAAFLATQMHGAG